MSCDKFKDVKVNTLHNNLFKKYIYSSTPIEIPSTTETGYSYAYSLNNTFIDPFQNSPPNEFMQKLEKRLHTYSGIK